MSKFELIKASSVVQNVDAVVNAANKNLAEGHGVCGAIFKAAGSAELTAACSKHMTPLKDGEAVMTPAFGITNAKAVIHAVGPDFRVDGTRFKELFDAYYNSLMVLKDSGYHSISFPLISAGIFAGKLSDPVGESTKQCLRAFKKFTADYPDYDISVKLCAFTDSEMAAAKAAYDAFSM